MLQGSFYSDVLDAVISFQSRRMLRNCGALSPVVTDHVCKMSKSSVYIRLHLSEQVT